MHSNLPPPPHHPHSTAGMGEGLRACARHPAYDAAKFCLSCAAPLCRACGSTKAHQLCPPCAQKVSGHAHRTDVQWQTTLLMDALRDWRPLLVHQIFPTAVMMSLVALAGLFLFRGQFGGDDSAGLTDDYLLASGWIVATLTLGALVVQPGVFAARKDLRPFGRRLAGGAARALPFGIAFAGLGALGFVHPALAAVVACLFILIAPFLPAFLSYVQASHQLGAWSLGMSLQRLGRLGLLPLLCAGVLTGCGGLMLTSLFYPLILIVGGLWLVGPTLGFLALFVVLMITQLAFSYFFGAVGTSLFRLVEDREHFAQ